MSFPQYNRVDTGIGQDYDDFEDVSFATLAKYANNDQDSDISLLQCTDDLNGFGEGGSNVGLIFQTGYNKADNLTGSSNNRKARSEFGVRFNLGSDFRLTNQFFYAPSTNPFGAAFTDQAVTLIPTTLKITNLRLCMVCEEDDLEYPSSLTNTKVQRYMLGTSATNGELPNNLPYTHNRVFSVNTFTIGDSNISQNNVYGVPNRFFIDEMTIEHAVGGSGTYYMWVTIGYNISPSGNAYGWNITSNKLSYSAWRGAFTRSAGSAFTTINSNIDPFLGLENNFAPVDTTSGSYLSGLNNNFADFKIDITVDVGFLEV